MEIGKRIREVRLKQNMKQKELADKLDNISNVQLSNIESGKRQPRVDEVEKICDALNVSMSYLFRHEEEDKVNKRKHLQNEYDHEINIDILQDRLFSTRMKNNLTREELSVRSDIPIEIITELETGQSIPPEEYPSVETVFNLAAGLGVTPDYLYGYVENEDDFSDRTPKIPDLEDFIEENLTVYKGTPLTRQDKERLKNVLASLFFEAYERELKNKKETNSEG